MDDDFFSTILGWLVIGGIIFAIAGWSGDGWVGLIRYAVYYKVRPDNVHISRKPYDCDWGTAPIGSKHCSYEPVVSAYNAAGDTIPDAKPKFSTDTNTGKLIVSFDQGNTWAWPTILDYKVKSVEVQWSKVVD